jgi:hypothetical protein
MSAQVTIEGSLQGQTNEFYWLVPTIQPGTCKNRAWPGTGPERPHAVVYATVTVLTVTMQRKKRAPAQS